MFNVSVGEQDGKTDFTMLLIIDLDHNYYCCLFSTLMFTVNQTKQLNIRAPWMTFDWPFWLKPLDILNAELFNVVPILGGFHTMMSFLDSTGTLMNGSGLSDCLETELKPTPYKR